MGTCYDQACAARSFEQPRLFRCRLRHKHPGSKNGAVNIGRTRLVQPLNGKPNLVLVLSDINVYVNARQPLDLVLVQSKKKPYAATVAAGLPRNRADC